MIFQEGFEDFFQYIIEWFAGLFTGVTLLSTAILIVGIILFVLNLGLWIWVYFDAKKKGLIAWAIFIFGWLFTGLFGLILYWIIVSKIKITKNKAGKVVSTCVLR